MSKEYTRIITTLGNVPLAGSVILSDDFESILKWIQSSGTGDSIFELDPTIALRGNQSLYMKTRTTSAAANDKIGANFLTHILPNKIVTFIGSFRYPTYNTMKTLQFEFYWSDGARLYIARCQFLPNTPKWQYINSLGNDTDIPDSDTLLYSNSWHTVILKMDFNTLKYISLQVDHLLFDLSNFSLYDSQPMTTSRFEHYIYITTIGANPTSINLDEIIMLEA